MNINELVRMESERRIREARLRMFTFFAIWLAVAVPLFVLVLR
jgi:hypothetical protein